MAQLRLGYPDLQKRNVEIVQITHSTAAEARLYFARYPLAFPYLCDADRAAHLRYGIELAPHTLASGITNVVASSTVAVGDLLLRGDTPVPPMPYLRRYGFKDSPQALFIVDEGGIIRSVHVAGGIGAIPSTQDLAREIDALR
jgi:AhpC/TSA family